jgi:carbonic anhydrase
VGATDQLLQRHAQLEPRTATRLPGEPSLRLAIVTCMDCRIDLFTTFSLRRGEAHILRNAGGAVTDDVIRSLAISQLKLGTREIMLIHHTRCGMTTFTEGEFHRELENATGLRPPWAVEAFTDIEDDVRQSMRRIRQSPFLGQTTGVRGFVHDVDTGAVTEVD